MPEQDELLLQQIIFVLKDNPLLLVLILKFNKMTENIQPLVTSKARHEQKMLAIKQKYSSRNRRTSTPLITKSNQTDRGDQDIRNTAVNSSSYNPSANVAPLNLRLLNYQPSSQVGYDSFRPHNKDYQTLKVQYATNRTEIKKTYSKELYSQPKKQQNYAKPLQESKYDNEIKIRIKNNIQKEGIENQKKSSPIKQYKQSNATDWDRLKGMRIKQLEQVHRQRSNSTKIEKQKNHKTINDIQTILQSIKRQLFNSKAY